MLQPGEIPLLNNKELKITCICIIVCKLQRIPSVVVSSSVVALAGLGLTLAALGADLLASGAGTAASLNSFTGPRIL